MIANMQKKSWSELTTAQKSGIVAGIVVQVALLIAALADIRRRPAEQINGSKRMWAALSFVNYVGPIAYFVFGRKR